MEATTKRVPSSTNLLKSRGSGIMEVHTMTPQEQEEELREAMKIPLASVSRQRLRAIQINFRRCGSVDNCITSRELMNVFNEHNLGIPSRTFQMLIGQFNEATGINHERLWKFLVEAQSKTGRDSVQAIHKTHNHYMGHRFNDELSTADRAMLEKVHKALMASKEYDLNELRTSCEDKDPSRNGQIPKKKFKRIIEEQHLPLSGALLNNLLKKCDEESNGMVNWFEFMVLLEKAENLSISHTKTDVAEDGTTQPNHGSKSNHYKKPTTNGSITASNKPNAKPAVTSKAKGKQFNNNNITKKPNNEEKEKSTPSDQNVKGRSSVLSDSGKEPSRKVTFRTGENSPSSSCNSSRRGSLSSVAGDSDFIKGNGQQSPRIGSAKTKNTRPGSSTNAQSRPGSTVPGQSRPGSVGPGQVRPGSSTPGQPGSTVSGTPTPARPASAGPGQDQSPRPGSRNTPNSSRRGSVTSQGGKRMRKPPPLAKRTIKQKDPKLPHSMSMQNMTSISEVSTENDIHHSESSPNLISTAPSNELEDETDLSESLLNQSISSQNSIATATQAEQKDPFENPLNQSISSQNSMVAGTQEQKVVAMDTKSGTSSPGSINLSLDSGSVSSQEQQTMPRIESTQSLTSTSSHSSADSHAPDTAPLLQGSLGQAKNWGKPVKLMNSFKGFLSRRKSTDKVSGSKVKIPQEPVKMDVVVREQPMTVYVPDSFVNTKLKHDEPKENLSLNWIYGYRGNDCRNNLHQVSNGEIVYFISWIVIIYNHKEHKQRYYKEHNADIRSIAVHEDKVTIATGQSDLDGTKKHIKTCIRIWNSSTLKTSHVIEDDGFQQAIICLSFSQNLLAAVDNYETHTLSLWDAKTFKKVSETKCNTDVVCQVGFHPKMSTRIVSIGKDHLVFWDLKGSAIQQTMEADYGENAKAKFIICMLFRSNGDLVTGDSNGAISIWSNGQNTISKVIRMAHECPVFSLIEHDGTLLSGGRDGSIYGWDVKESNCSKSSQLLIPASAGGARTILIANQYIYIGTTLNCILGSELSDTGPLLTGASIDKHLITQGHYDEIHGLKVYPAQTAQAPPVVQTAQGVFLTCGYDGMICCYNSNTHLAMWKHWVKDCNIQCVDIHPSGNVLVLGAKSADPCSEQTGAVEDQLTNISGQSLGQCMKEIILPCIGSSLCFFNMNLEGNLFELNRSKISKSMITTVKFSPDGQTLAAGCYDGRITTVKLVDDGRRTEIIGKCNIHQSSITGLDWSKNKCYNGDYVLQSSSSSLEYFNFTPSCELINDLVDTRNTEWMTNSCMLGYYTNGIWGGEMCTTEYTTVARSHNQNLLATGDEDGDVKLFSHPCNNQEAKFKNFHGHAFGVNSLSFGENDKMLLSVGTRDCAILQWSFNK